MIFKPNIHFTLLVKVEGRLREFNFRQRTDDSYDADTSDERGNRYLFKWSKSADGWDIVPISITMPVWITESKPSIAAKFDQYMNEANAVQGKNG